MMSMSMNNSPERESPLIILPFFQPDAVKEALCGIKELDCLKIEDKSCYWVGSVTLADEERFSSFLKHAELGELAALSEFGELSAQMAYAFLVETRGEETAYWLFVVKYPNDALTQAQECLLAKKLYGIKVEGKVLPDPPLKHLSKVSLVDYLKAFLSW